MLTGRTMTLNRYHTPPLSGALAAARTKIKRNSENMFKTGGNVGSEIRKTTV